MQNILALTVCPLLIIEILTKNVSNLAQFMKARSHCAGTRVDCHQHVTTTTFTVATIFFCFYRVIIPKGYEVLID